MKRLVALTLMLALSLTLAACGGADTAEEPRPDDDRAAEEAASAPTPATGEGYEPIPVDGEGEREARSAADAALPEAQRLRESGGVSWPDLSGIEPDLNAYLIAVEMSDQIALFEVRADGIAHSIHAYQKPFDAGTMVWTPAGDHTTPRHAPRSAREQAAVLAVTEAVRDEFPDASFSVDVYGYRFVWIRDGSVALFLELAVDGTIISVGN